jgi:hypothetical protein
MPLVARAQRSTSGRHPQKEIHVKNERKETDKKKGTLRPWLVDVSLEHLR